MKIRKILNNNVVVILNQNGAEEIICGRGIGFQKKPGMEIDASAVNQRFVLSSQQENERFQQIVADIPLENLALCDQVIQMIRLQLGQKLSETIYITLTDHVSTAIERAREGVLVPNTMLWEIQHYYETEYQIALKVLDMIEKQTGIRLKDDEAGFIALHIVNAETENSRLEETVETTRIIQEITKIVRYHFQREFDVDSVYYYRFITHLKFFARRVVHHKEYNGNEDDDLVAIVKQKYADSWKCIEKIADMLSRSEHYEISDQEKLYLTIHVHRIAHA